MSEIKYKISESELATLRKSIANTAVLSAISDDGIIDNAEKEEALRLAKIRTYTSDEILHEFYEEVKTHFEKDFNDAIDSIKGKSDDEQKDFLRNQLDGLDPILVKLSVDFVDNFLQSQQSLAERIFKANSNWLMHFFMPFKNKMTEKIFGKSEEEE